MRRVSIVLAAALLAAGCGTASPVAAPPAQPGAPATEAGPGPGPGPGQQTTADTLGAGPRHNAADVDFVRALIPHHRGGIALAAAAARNPKARVLAEAIIVTQQDEVVRMTEWLTTWGATPPASTAPKPPVGDPIQALITHQEKAVELAQQEQANGVNLSALAFAKQVIESRTGQVSELRSYR
jgi:uncharacterized protein (DUF305 family)